MRPESPKPARLAEITEVCRWLLELADIAEAIRHPGEGLRAAVERGFERGRALLGIDSV